MIENIFSTGITKANLSGFDNKPFVEYAENNSLQNANKDVTSILNDSKFNVLNGTVLDLMTEFYNKIYSDVKYRIYLKEAWTNVNNDKLITFPHNHKECLLSAVYYPLSTDGEIVFLNPMQSLLARQNNDMVKDYNQYNSEYYRFKVSTGDLVIFNSMLYHFITPSESKRISIAYNGDIKKGGS